MNLSPQAQAILERAKATLNCADKGLGWHEDTEQIITALLESQQRLASSLTSIRLISRPNSREDEWCKEALLAHETAMKELEGGE